MAPKILAVWIIISLVLAGIWDIAVTFYAIQQETVSRTFLTWSQSFPPLLLALGILIGHLFWPQPK